MRIHTALSLTLVWPALAAAGPNLYYDVGSAYRTLHKVYHASAWGGAVEIPWGEKLSWVARARYLQVAQDPWQDANMAEDFYAEGYPARYRLAGAQASLRVFPWEWMPGFFAEGLLGGKRIEGSFETRQGFADPYAESYTTYALETAVGAGYRWSWGPLRTSVGLAFGPEFVFRGGRQTDYTDLLRFNALEIGCAL
jgi:hypothetical protein